MPCPTRCNWRRTVPDGTVILVNLSGRGDKDVQSVTEALGK
jgi:tryptophan synthase beta subunit